METVMKIKINIKPRMAYLGIKSRELAPQLGISECNLSLMINGKTKSITYTMIAKLCIILNCQPNDLLEVVQ